MIISGKTNVDDEEWTEDYFVDRIFNDLMKTDLEKQTNSNKYIQQLAKKFILFVTRSPTVRFEIYINDLDKESLAKIKQRGEKCKTVEEAYNNFNYIFTEVIYRIAKQTEPLILSKVKDGDPTIDKMQFNRMREWVSKKWILLNIRGVESR